MRAWILLSSIPCSHLNTGTAEAVGTARREDHRCAGDPQGCLHLRPLQEVRQEPRSGLYHHQHFCLSYVFAKSSCCIHFAVKFPPSAQEVDPAVRKERKQWVKLLQRVECVDAASFDVMAEALRDVGASTITYCLMPQVPICQRISQRVSLQRHEKRAGWAAREKDPMFATVPFNCRPLPCPIADKLLATPAPGTLPRVTSLLNLAQCVDQWKKAFLANKK